MTKTISLEDALETIGKGFLLILAVCMAICLIASPLRAAATAVNDFLKLVVRFLAVAVPVIALVMLVLWVLLLRFRTRSNANSARNRDDV